MNTNFIAPGQIWKVKDSGRYTHYYIVLGQAQKILSKVQMMCITSMKDKKVTTEVPIVVNGMVGYVIPQNIHSFGYTDLIEKYECVGQVFDTRISKVSEFIELLVSMWNALNLPWFDTLKYRSTIEKFDRYCSEFSKENKGTQEYRTTRYTNEPQMYHYVRCGFVSEVLSPGSDVLITDIAPVEVREKTKTQMKKERQEIRRRDKELRKLAKASTDLYTMTDRDIERLRYVESVAPGTKSDKWGTELLEILADLKSRYTNKTLSENSRRWTTPNAMAICTRRAIVKVGTKPNEENGVENSTESVKDSSHKPKDHKPKEIGVEDMKILSHIDTLPKLFKSWGKDDQENFLLLTDTYRYHDIVKNSSRFNDISAVSKAVKSIRSMLGE